ncbi:MAG: recombinase family protein [Candidatus Competibacteraceae bacterium]|nr:MAG: recombinase family protein [Candidatus Competibacteraceae bacterium]
MATKTIAYLQVSTDKQADKGISLEAQQDKAKAYASLYDLDLVEVIIDAGESAKTLERPGLQRALSMLKTGQADALLVVKLDRLTRSVVDLGKLIETYFAPGKAALLSVSEQIDTRSAAGRPVLNILASVSQWERETIAERTRDAMRHKQSQGEYIGGGAPYGFELVNGDLVEDSFEQGVIQQARELRDSGLSLAAVAKELDRRGIQSRNAKPFAAMQIKRLVA